MKMSFTKTLVCLVVSSPACLWAADLRCSWDGHNPNARMNSQYDISVDERGTLLSVDGQEAKSIGEEKYRAGSKTFWYYADNQRLRRFDAAAGNTYYDCR